MNRHKGLFNRTLWCAMLVAAPLILGSTPPRSADLGDRPIADQPIHVPGGQQRVTVRFRDMALSQVLRLIGQRANLSFSIAPDVAGRVTYDFNDETLDRMLEVILSSNSLQIRQVGKTYIVSQSAAAGMSGVRVFPLNYASAIDLVKLVAASLQSAGIKAPDKQLNADPRSNAIIASGNDYFLRQVGRLIQRLDQPQEHKIYSLNYIKAEDAATLLSTSLFAGAANTGVKFIPIVRDNSLMVVASPEDLRLVTELLGKVDRRLRQVLIEVKLVELNGTASNILGVTFDAQTGTLAGAFDPTTGTSVTYNPLQSALSQVRAQINVLLRDNKARLLASPTILAMDAKESKIEISDDIITKVQLETTVNATTTITRQNVELGTAGIKLAITPKINPDGYISMKVSPEISFIRDTVHGANNNEILATLKSQRRLDTPEVRVRDGETLIIGGLNQERTQENVDKMPLLGDLPFIGGIFRRTDHTKVTTELVVLLTPKVVPEGDIVPRSTKP